jgi:hypothetical protein
VLANQSGGSKWTYFLGPDEISEKGISREWTFALGGMPRPAEGVVAGKLRKNMSVAAGGQSDWTNPYT